MDKMNKFINWTVAADRTGGGRIHKKIVSVVSFLF